jgi:hypothetical protein
LLELISAIVCRGAGQRAPGAIQKDAAGRLCGVSATPHYCSPIKWSKEQPQQGDTTLLLRHRSPAHLGLADTCRQNFLCFGVSVVGGFSEGLKTPPKQVHAIFRFFSLMARSRHDLTAALASASVATSRVQNLQTVASNGISSVQNLQIFVGRGFFASPRALYSANSFASFSFIAAPTSLLSEMNRRPRGQRY